MDGFATPTGFAGHAGAKANAKLTFDPDHSVGADHSLYVAGISSGSKQADAAKALIAFLTSPAVKQAFTAKGFEPR